mgnify:CR=1 FL=1
MRRATCALTLALMWPVTALGGEVNGDLETMLDDADPNQVISVLVYLTDRVEPAVLSQQMTAQRATLSTRHEVVVTALRDTAQRSQAPIIST